MIHECILEKSETGIHFISLDPNIVSEFNIETSKRVICRINQQIDVHCAIMSTKDGRFFVMIGSSICKKLKLKQGSVLTASFKLDSSEYQFEMPEELDVVLQSDEEAFSVFQTLTKGNQRGLMYLVNQVKSPEKRIERALKMAIALKNGITSPKLILK